MKLVKKTLLTLTTPLIVTALVLWTLTQSIKPELVTNILFKQIFALTSQPSHIDGDITWQLFPRPGIKVTHITVGEDSGQESVAVSIDNLLLTLQIKPLITGKLVFSRLFVDGFKIDINSTVPANTSNNNPEKSLSALTQPAQFSIDNVLLTHGQINIVGQNQRLLLTGLQIDASQMNLQHHTFPVHFKGVFSTSSTDYNLNANLNFKGWTHLTDSLFSTAYPRLKDILLDGQLLIEDLHFNQLEIAQINTSIRTDQEGLTLSPLNLSLYNGKSTGDLTFNLHSKKLAVNQTATGVNANLLSKALLGKSLLNGNLDFSIHATTSLQNTHWRDHLRGNGNLTVKNGVLNFVDLHQVVDNITKKVHVLLQDNLKGVPAPQMNHFAAGIYQPGKTTFQLLTIQYQVQQSMLLHNSLTLQTHELQLKGNGLVHLNDYAIATNLSAKLNTSDMIMAQIQQSLDGNFPFKIYGKLTNPLVSADMKKISPLLTKYLLSQSLAEPAIELEKTLNDLLVEF